jgi:hypothetical protein
MFKVGRPPTRDLLRCRRELVPAREQRQDRGRRADQKAARRATLEDIQHHLYVLGKIKMGQRRLNAEGGIPQAVMEEQADLAALARAHDLESGKSTSKSQAEVFKRARAAL